MKLKHVICPKCCIDVGYIGKEVYCPNCRVNINIIKIFIIKLFKIVFIGVISGALLWLAYN